MDLTHKTALYLALGFVGISLIIPGLIEIFKPHPGSTGLILETIDAKNQLRALNAMMTGIGCMAIWACTDLVHSRNLVLSLGGILMMVVIARIYSSMVDKFPGTMTWVYTVIELLLSQLFLIWPPHE